MASVNKTADRVMSSSSIDKTTGCWEWNLSKQSNGYGQMKHEGKMKRAHRVSFEAFIGPIPCGMEILHSCDNRGCVNPEHLSVGTHKDNMTDMEKKGRVRRGHDHPMFGRSGLSGAKSHQSIPVEINGITYGSQKEAERHLSVSHGSVRYWISTGKAKIIGEINGK